MGIGGSSRIYCVAGSFQASFPYDDEKAPAGSGALAAIKFAGQGTTLKSQDQRREVP